MSEQANVRTVEAIYAAFGRGDLGAVLTTLDEDVAWRHPRPDDIPWGGERHGRDAVAEFLIATNRYLEVEEFTPEQFVARDNQVIVFGHSMALVQRDRTAFGRWPTNAARCSPVSVDLAATRSAGVPSNTIRPLSWPAPVSR